MNEKSWMNYEYEYLIKFGSIQLILKFILQTVKFNPKSKFQMSIYVWGSQIIIDRIMVLEFCESWMAILLICFVSII